MGDLKNTILKRYCASVVALVYRRCKYLCDIFANRRIFFFSLSLLQKPDTRLGYTQTRDEDSRKWNFGRSRTFHVERNMNRARMRLKENDHDERGLRNRGGTDTPAGQPASQPASRPAGKQAPVLAFPSRVFRHGIYLYIPNNLSNEGILQASYLSSLCDRCDYSRTTSE